MLYSTLLPKRNVLVSKLIANIYRGQENEWNIRNINKQLWYKNVNRTDTTVIIMIVNVQLMKHSISLMKHKKHMKRHKIISRKNKPMYSNDISLHTNKMKYFLLTYKTGDHKNSRFDSTGVWNYSATECLWEKKYVINIYQNYSLACESRSWEELCHVGQQYVENKLGKPMYTILNT